MLNPVRLAQDIDQPVVPDSSADEGVRCSLWHSSVRAIAVAGNSPRRHLCQHNLCGVPLTPKVPPRSLHGLTGQLPNCGKHGFHLHGVVHLGLVYLWHFWH
jgi:hypothetical protein